MKKCIVNFEDREILSAFADLGYECIPVIQSDKVSAPICAHSDVLYRKIGTDIILVSDCQKANIPALEDCGYKTILFSDLKPGYKTESYLNFIINSKYIICNTSTALQLDSNMIGDRKIIKVRQGYTSCSTLQVTEDAYITDDENIYKILCENKTDCLLIEKGNITLDGYNYGFIGGASVNLGENKILFFGEIENINDKNNVITFLEKYNMEAIFIKDKKLKDIGSALIL